MSADIDLLRSQLGAARKAVTNARAHTERAMSSEAKAIRHLQSIEAELRARTPKACFA